MQVRAWLPHGVAAKGPPECEIAAPRGPWQREIQSVKLRRLPWGLRSLRLPWGGSSTGRRRASAQALPLPARATRPQTTLLLQNTLPKSSQPLVCPSHAAAHPCPAAWCPSPTVSPPWLSPFPSQTIRRLQPRFVPQPALPLAGWQKAPSAFSSAYRILSCAQDLYKTLFQGHGSGLENAEKGWRRKACKGSEVSPFKSCHCPQDAAC